MAMEQNFNNVRLTATQVRDIGHWAENKDPPAGNLAFLVAMGNERDALRLAHAHGARLIAEMYAAGYLVPGQDPVEAFGDMIHGAPKRPRKKRATR